MILINWQRNIYRTAIRRIRSKSCVRNKYGFGTYDLNDRVLRACVLLANKIQCISSFTRLSVPVHRMSCRNARNLWNCHKLPLFVCIYIIHVIRLCQSLVMSASTSTWCYFRRLTARRTDKTLHRIGLNVNVWHAKRPYILVVLCFAAQITTKLDVFILFFKIVSIFRNFRNFAV